VLLLALAQFFDHLVEGRFLPRADYLLDSFGPENPWWRRRLAAL
jgi:hypothetical protein